jgi:hypothetical protein
LDIEIIDNIQLTPKPSLGKHHWVQSPSQEIHIATWAQLAQDDFNACLATSMSLAPSLILTQLSDSEDCFDDHLSSPLLSTQEDDFNACHASSISPMPPLILTASSSSLSIESMPSTPASSVAVKPICQQPVPLSNTLYSAQAASHIIPIHIPIYDPAKLQQRWPHGIYTVDMVVGFQQMAIIKLCDFYSQEQLFTLSLAILHLSRPRIMIITKHSA